MISRRTRAVLLATVCLTARGGAQPAGPVPPSSAPGSAAAPPARGAAPVTVAYREAADLFELLDQVSAWWPDYVEPEYRHAWIASGRARPDDSVYFARYARLRTRFVDRTGQEGSGGRRGGSGLFTAGATRTADPVAAAFYASETLAEALGRLRGVLPPDDLAFLRTFYTHFAARTAPLLAATRERTATSRAATARTLADTAVQTYLTQLTTLFGAASAGSGMTALYVWWPDSMHTRASPNGRALLLRVRPGTGEVINSADVVAHETVHVLAAGLPAVQQRALSATFLDGCPVPEDVRRLVVWEEPIATALGNIEFRRRFMPQRFAWGRRWYGDAWADVFARLLQPVLVERLATGGALDPAFARDAAGLCAALVRLRPADARPGGA